jgi:CHAT domain-containing protein/tetratricopeptide (TPR) repeat protein
MPSNVAKSSLPVLCLLHLALLLGATPLAARAAQEEPVTPERPAEYMIYQYPDIALVVRVDVPETEFGVRVLGPEDAVVKSSGVPGRRIGPVFTYIDAADLPRQLMIEVTPGRAIARSAISLEVLQFAAGDRNGAALSRAYRLFSLGTETALSDDTTSWAMKTYSLRNAADLFDQLGMEEMRLWSEYFAAHQVLHQLEDRLMAMELSQEIQRAAVRAGFARVDLAARVLEGDALLQQLTRPAASDPDYPRMHELLQGVAALAARLGFPAEAGRAYFKDGLVFDHQGEAQQALEQYERALEVVAQAGHPELLKEVRATAATAYEALGSTAGALEMLDEMAGELAAGPQDEAALELADRLLEKGRLLNATYRYRDALSELARALELQQANAANRSWGPTGLELAWAQYSLGRADEAIALIQEALPRTPPEGNAKLLARAYGSLANMHRARGQFEQAAQARETQGTLVGEGEGRAGLLFETAMDARQRYGPASREAREMLRWSGQAAAGEGDRLTEARSALQLCLLEIEGGGEAACSDSAARTAQAALRDSGVPRLAAEAGLARLRLLRRTGQTGEARGELDRLLDELQWYRRFLPGVLGAWYPESRTSLAQESLALSLTGAAAAQDARGDSPGARFLLALERIRAVEASDAANPALTPLDPGAEEALRSALARCEAARGDAARDLAAEVNRQIEGARHSCPQCGLGAVDRVSAGALQALLQGLDRSEGLLAYVLDGGDARAVLAGRSGVRIVSLAQPERIQQLLARTRESAARAEAGPASAAALADLESLGKLLLQPLGRDLPARIYLLPSGPLRAIPFDALRLGGRYLAEQHLLVNLASLGSLERRQPSLSDGYRDRVFVAGNPQNQRDPFRFEISRSPEIDAVTDRFVGPGLQVVQGVALRKDEFADERFARAALVHLAIPGVIDLASPERSRLLLAAAADGTRPGRVSANPADYLSPADVTAFELDADLLLLSATGVTGNDDSPFDGRMPLVSDFLAAGAGAVLYSLWPAGEEVAAEFARAFYGRLESDPDIASAFMAARRAAIEAGGETNLSAWAGFQLFIR